MAENRFSEIEDEGEDSVPQIIDEEYFKAAQVKSDKLIKDLREKEQYLLAREFIRLFSLTENLFLNLKDEQKLSHALAEQQIDATGQIEEALKISQKDRDVVSKLREEVIEAWKLSDAAKMREVEMAERLEGMRMKYEKTQEELKKFTRKIDETGDGPLGKHKVTMVQEIERLNEEINELNKRLKIQRGYSDEIQRKLDNSLEANRGLHYQWDEATNEGLANKKKVKSLMMQLEEMDEKLDKSNENLNHYKSQAEVRHVRLKERDAQLNDMRERFEETKIEFDALLLEKTKLDEKLKDCSAKLTDLSHEMDQTKAFLRLKEDDFKKLTLESQQKQKKIDGFIRKVFTLEKTISKNEEQILTQKNEIVTAEKERDSIRRTNDAMKRDNDNLHKKIENMQRDLEKRDEILNDLKTEKSLIVERNLSLDQELKQSVEREKKSSQNVRSLFTKLEIVESEKDFLGESMKELGDELREKNQSVEKIKSEREAVTNELATVKHQHSTTMKQLKELEADFQKCREKESDVRDRWMKCKSQVDDTNNKLMGKMSEIASLEKKIRKIEKQNRELKRDLGGCGDFLKQTRDEVKTLGKENSLLNDEIRENESRFTKMKTQMDKIIHERDLISKQMLRRQDENELLEKETNVMKTAFERANGMYNERLEDIKLLKNEIRSLRSQSNILKRGLQNTTDMRHEVLQLHRKLNQERNKSKVLEQEMSTPMNVHRWRKLNRFDAKRIDLLKKCQRLQQTALMQTAKVSKAEEIIQKLKEKVELLEKDLSSRPIEAVYDKLRAARSQLESNTKRMKAAVAISRSSNDGILMKEAKIEKLEKECYEMKKQFLKEKIEKSNLLQKIRDMKKEDESAREFEIKTTLETCGNEMK